MESVQRGPAGQPDMRRVVFAALVTWSSPVQVSRAPAEEYELLRTRVSEEGGLYMGSRCFGEHWYYDAVVVLRDRLAMAGEIMNWTSAETLVHDVPSGVPIEDFLAQMQVFCARDSAQMFGEHIAAKTGDAETLTMLQTFSGNRLGSLGGPEVAWLTRKMRGHQRSAAGDERLMEGSEQEFAFRCRRAAEGVVDEVVRAVRQGEGLAGATAVKVAAAGTGRGLAEVSVDEVERVRKSVKL